MIQRGGHEQTTGQTFKNIKKNVNILEFHDHIWNYHEKYIQISTNIPGIGSLICKIDVKYFRHAKRSKNT